MPPFRTIAHFDLDAFFVEVEILNRPELRGKPLIVGGSRERGVVTTCSYEARRFGVHSAMPMSRAVQLCPQAIILPGSRGEYSKFSRWVTEIIAAKAPLFEKASIDEFYIDLTGMDRYFDPFGWTVKLREEIMDKTRLPISFGMATSKMVAKIATNEAKPNGYLQVPAGMEADFLAPLGIDKIPGVGEHTSALLKDMGIRLIRDIANYPVEQLEQRIGRYGMELWQKARGEHAGGEVSSYHEAKSVSTENTFHENTDDLDFLMSELVRMTEKVAHELRADDKMAGCLSVKVRYPDFETTQRQVSIPYSFYDDELIPIAKDLFHKLYRKGQKVRLLGVRLSELTGGALQTNLFSDTAKKSGLYRAIDDVRHRYGKKLVTRGGAMGKNG
jgi:DNA polymerase-4